jgi:formate hydrogenlyase subunit 4
VLFASPLLEGVMRKVKAIIHSRKDPDHPALPRPGEAADQEDLASEPGLIARLRPRGVRVGAGGGVLRPVRRRLARGAGDLFLFIYLITLSSACIMAGGLAHSSPFSHLGSSREMMMVVTVEGVIITSLLIVGVSGHTGLLSDLTTTSFRWSFLLGLVCYLFAMQALLGKLPFDIPEAEQEIMNGPFIEYSGPSLALFKWAFYMKQLIFGSLFFGLFVGWPHLAGWGVVGSLVNFVVNFAAVLVLSLLVVLVDATNPRLRIDQSLRFFAGLIGVALLGVGLAAFGL